jgi:hypothetical protein
MTDRPPIPPALWQRVLSFLRDGATGQIVLDVHRGKVTAVSLNERVRDEASTPASSPPPPVDPTRDPGRALKW